MRALLLLAMLAGCNTVKPYQREYLAQPGMKLTPTADTEADSHMLESREGSMGGSGVLGGGCGCN
jgi:uncharacterized protein DUF4266